MSTTVWFISMRITYSYENKFVVCIQIKKYKNVFCLISWVHISSTFNLNILKSFQTSISNFNNNNSFYFGFLFSWSLKKRRKNKIEKKKGKKRKKQLWCWEMFLQCKTCPVFPFVIKGAGEGAGDKRAKNSLKWKIQIKSVTRHISGKGWHKIMIFGTLV